LNVIKTKWRNVLYAIFRLPWHAMQTMERRRLADSLPTHQALLNTPFGDKPSLRHFSFQAALGHKKP
jgi:hypothetical protein